LIQLAAVTGVYGVSFLVVWTALALYSSVAGFVSQSHHALRLAG
jgi:apolipoprotein N-acyltransferase